MFRTLWKAGAAVVVASALGALISGSVVAVSQTTFLNPQGTGYTIPTGWTTGSVQVIGSNATRRSIQICNPSAVVWWIAPSPLTPAVNGAGSYGLPAASTGTTVCFTPPTGGVSPAGSSAGNAWNGLPASSPATLTIYEW